MNKTRFIGYVNIFFALINFAIFNFLNPSLLYGVNCIVGFGVGIWCLEGIEAQRTFKESWQLTLSNGMKGRK